MVRGAQRLAADGRNRLLYSDCGRRGLDHGLRQSAIAFSFSCLPLVFHIKSKTVRMKGRARMLKALTVTLALISCLPAWGQPPKPTTGETDSSNRPGTSNTCADATYAANHPDACHPQPPPTPSSGSTSSKKPNPCTNQTYAAAHPYDAATGGGCKQAKPGTSPVSGPTLGCSGNLNPDAGCGPNNGNPPTYPNGVQVSGTLDCAGGNCDNSGSEDNSGSASDGGGVGGAVVGFGG